MSTPSEDKRSIIEKTAESFGRDMEEAKSLGRVDEADSDVETLFDQGRRTEDSPAHQAVWSKKFPTDIFDAKAETPNAECQKAMDDSFDLLKKHKDAGTLYDENYKLRPEIFEELAKVGYWGVLIDKEYGGKGSSFTQFAKFLSRVATVEPTVAGLASVHGCIGAVDPVTHFGSEEQRKKFLPRLASGESLSAFALTEPGAGSDLTAIKTEAKLVGDYYEVTGEKLFITNAGLGRTIGLVCLVDGKQSVLIADLPEAEDETFQIKEYGIWALARARNVGLKFNKFKVPKENLLEGKGLMIAYHGLNKGRVALCANAAGTMRSLLSNMIPWAKYRITYTKEIAERELVQKRLGELLGLIVSCDALTTWCAWLLDQGYRGEMECIIAKRWGSESLKEAAIEYFMKTHGGRSFLHGHMFGDNIHDFLAPCIYEGEGEMLSLAFFKALTKQHGETYFLPISDKVGYYKKKGWMKDFNPVNPLHVWLMKGPLFNYSTWVLGEVSGRKTAADYSFVKGTLRKELEFAIDKLQKLPGEISGAMVKYQVALIDRQCKMAQLSEKAQDLIVMASTAVWASRQESEIVKAAAELQCERIRLKITGKLPNDRYFRKATKLGARVIAGEYEALKEVPADELLMKYK